MKTSDILKRITNQHASANNQETYMYQLDYDDLYEDRYDPYDDSDTYVYADACIVSLIEELYDSNTLNKKQIVSALNNLIREIEGSSEATLKEKDLTLAYDCPISSWKETFCSYLDCISPVTGDLDYKKLCDTDRGFALKEIRQFDSSIDALEALIAQLTTQITFSDGIISGAIIYLAARYGVSFQDAINFKVNVKRGSV